MTDLELLEQYEPTLRFAKGERFFPMSAEAYVGMCQLFPYAPDAALEYLEHGEIRKEPLIQVLGKLKHERFFLRFVNKSFNYGRAWRWLIALSVLGLGAGIFWGATGIEADLLLTFVVALFLFMLASPVRLRIIPSALAVIVFCGLSFAPVWFFLNPNDKISFAVEYLILLPIYVFLLFYALMHILRFAIDRVIPEGPGAIMDMLSRATEPVAQEAYRQYAKILENEPRPVYYGRVLRETDEEGNRWTILQYHFFYAFNDWRLAVNGMNHHEGDWELTAVYLKNDAPYAVLFSQHGSGRMERWEKTLKAKDASGAETTHPVVFVALGSHANYSREGMIRSPSMYSPGAMQRFMLWLDGAIHYLFLWLNPKQRQIAVSALKKEHMHILDAEALAKIKYGDKLDQYVVRLPMEIATGDGYCAGPPCATEGKPNYSASQFLKRVKSRRETTRPAAREWRRILLDESCGWVEYKGLWGVKSWLDEESGAPGPRWERPKRNQPGVAERVRWGQPLVWLKQLEKQLETGGH